MGRTGTTRRRLFVVTGAVTAGALTGCSGGSSGESAERLAADAAAEEAAGRRRLAGASGALRDRYDATIARHPGLGARLSGLRASVSEHVTALGGATRTAEPVRVPSDEPSALASLADAERRTSDTHGAALQSTGDPEFARLLASVAAAGAAHAYLLTNGDSR
ncbi:hypothetical protein GCM10010387_47630 [Streptomyces inusitatus]|uniref:Lipoprotein n=1 Tax=Streptomyces inusitatus TaxID=68221 RepID=A0A918QIY2_9ACTN|nr:hypothetical protein [Streptomyces inusitatus]GGZ47749.1 hypothetical protein GCM10010387_47630 [Streptomyces inusitatus]